MERTQIYLTSEEARALDDVAASLGVTRSHLIREAIDSTYLTPKVSQRDRLLATLEELGAPWAHRDDLPDGETYVERIRSNVSPRTDSASETGRSRGRTRRAGRAP